MEWILDTSRLERANSFRQKLKVFNSLYQEFHGVGMDQGLRLDVKNVRTSILYIYSY